MSEVMVTRCGSVALAAGAATAIRSATEHRATISRRIVRPPGTPARAVSPLARRSPGDRCMDRVSSPPAAVETLRALICYIKTHLAGCIGAAKNPRSPARPADRSDEVRGRGDRPAPPRNGARGRGSVVLHRTDPDCAFRRLGTAPQARSERRASPDTPASPDPGLSSPGPRFACTPPSALREGGLGVAVAGGRSSRAPGIACACRHRVGRNGDRRCYRAGRSSNAAPDC